MSDGQLSEKPENKRRALGTLYQALKHCFEPPEGVKLKFRTVPATVSFANEGAPEPHKLLRSLRVELTLDKDRGPLSVKFLGLTISASKDNSGGQRLSMVCGISNKTMKDKLKFRDPNAKGDPRAEQTKLHQVVLVEETADGGFEARISDEFLKRYLRT